MFFVFCRFPEAKRFVKQPNLKIYIVTAALDMDGHCDSNDMIMNGCFGVDSTFTKQKKCALFC